MVLKGRIHEEDTNIVNIYAPNIGAPSYIRKTVGDSNTLTLGDFNTQLSTMDRSSKQNINKDIVELNDSLDQIDLTDIHRKFHPKEAK